MARERAREAEDLRHGVTEIERAEPAEGEDLELVAEEERLAERRRAARRRAQPPTRHWRATLPAGVTPVDVTSSLVAARSALESGGLARCSARRAGGAGGRGRRTCSPTSRPSWRPMCSRSRPTPGRLAVVQERRADLTRLVRAYGAGTPGGPPAGDLAAVLAWAKSAAARLAELDGDEDRIGSLAAQEADLAAAVAELAGQLTAARTATAARFAAEVTAELTALAMPHAKIVVAVTPAQGFGPHGADDVEIRLAAQPRRACPPAAQGCVRWCSCPGSCWPSRWCLPVPTRCRRSSSTRSTPAWAARRQSRSAVGWHGWPAWRR